MPERSDGVTALAESRSEMIDYRMHIGGERLPAASGETFETLNPFDGKPWARVPRSGAADADAAVEAAHRTWT